MAIKTQITIPSTEPVIIAGDELFEAGFTNRFSGVDGVRSDKIVALGCQSSREFSEITHM